MATIPSQTYTGPQLLGGETYTSQLVNVSHFSSLIIHVKCNIDIEIVPLWTNFNSGYETEGETLSYDSSANPAGQIFQIAVANSEFHYMIRVPGGPPTTSIFVSIYGAYFNTSPHDGSTPPPPPDPFIPEYLNWCISDETTDPNSSISFSATSTFKTIDVLLSNPGDTFQTSFVDTVQSWSPSITGGATSGAGSGKVYMVRWGCFFTGGNTTNNPIFQLTKGATIYPNSIVRINPTTEGSYAAGTHVITFNSGETLNLQMKMENSTTTIYFRNIFLSAIKVSDV